MNTVLDLFQQRVQCAGDEVAIVDENFRISYSDLNRWSNSIAAAISLHNPAPESPVLVLLPRSAKYIAAILGVLKSGCCYIPVDLKYPESRIKSISATAKVDLFIGDNFSCRQFGKQEKNINLDLLTYSDENENFAPPFIPGPENLAYIIFTSGSTGTPKGVEVEHHSLYNLVQWHHKEFSGNEPHRTTISASTGFDASVWETWSNITAGNTIYIVKTELVLNPPRLAKWLEQNEINECFLPTPLAEKLLEQTFSEKSKLKYLHSGGEQLKRYPPKNFTASLSNLYGPTECTVIAAWAVFQPGESSDHLPVIGKALDHCQIYLLDEFLQAVRPGEIGEIYIGGACLARGYCNLYDKTREVFIENPFLKGQRLYRSGDLGKCLPDNNYVFLGRKDFQVKIRGNRVELSEIEAVLEKHPKIHKSIVELRENSAGRKYLAAYLILKDKDSPCETELKEIAAQYLPDYMQPLSYTFLETFPLTAHGKIDRARLPEPKTNAIASVIEANPIEKILLEIWGKILKVGISSTDCGFYSQGGDSLLLVSLVLEVEDRFKLRLPVSFFMVNQTIKTQASHMIPILAGNDFTSYSKRVKKNPAKQNIKASPAQKKMWRQDTSSGGGSIFNIPLMIHLDGNLSPAAVEAALDKIIAKHIQLRTCFHFREEILYLAIQDKVDFHLPFTDLSGLDNERQVEQLNTWKEKYRAFKFDLSVVPLFAGRLFKCAEKRYELLLTIHHSIFDGWSSTIFLDELAALCSDFIDGRQRSIAADPDQPEYTDYLYWLEHWLESEDAEQQLSFWRKQLTGAQATPSLPFEQPDANYDPRAERWYFNIDEKRTAGLRKIATANNTTLFVILQAVLQMQLHRHTGALDLSTGTAVANRNVSGSEKILGLFINSLAIRGDLSGNPSLNNLIQQLNLKMQEIIKNQEYPFELSATAVQDVLRHKGSIFNISLLLQNIPHSAWKYPNVTLSADELGSDKAKLDIMITLEERAGKLIGWYEYKAAKFSLESIQAMQNDYCGLLVQAVHDPNRRINEYSCLEISLSARKTCFVFGETGMAVSACEILIAAGFHILATLSDDQQVIGWSDAHAIPSFDPGKTDIENVLKAVPFDYLFSVVYSYKIKDEFLRLARYEAINYHDGPLPCYAGMHASAWAILNQEKNYAVTWHRMSTLIDGGDIFKQQRIRIEPDDNSETLNLKCTLAGLECFRELLEEFKAGKNEAIAQNLSVRTYFGLYKRPDEFGFINCQKKAGELCALIQASDFGNGENVFNSAKFVWQKKYYIAGKAELAGNFSKAVLGEIVDHSGNCLSIQVADGTLKLSNLLGIDANRIDSAHFCCGSKITFPPVADPLFQRTYDQALRTEKYWVKAFTDCVILTFPLICFDNSESQIYTLDSQGFSYSAAALLGLFISRLLCGEDFTLALNHSGKQDFPGLYLDLVPWMLAIHSADTAEEVLQSLEQDINAILEKQPPLRDIYHRYHDLQRLDKLPFTVEIINGTTLLHSAPGTNCQNFISRFELFCLMLKEFLGLAVQQLPLITNKEAITQINDFNVSKRDYDLSSTWLETFKNRLPTYPANIAVICGQDKISYEELDRLSDCVAKEILIRRNVSRSSVAAVLAKPSKALIPVLLGIFKAGFTYMPVELKRYPNSRIRYILEDANCGILINLDQEAKNFTATIDLCQILDFSEGIRENGEFENLAINQEIPFNDNAYIIYTSGSTGIPKGVIISHKNLLNHNLGVIDDFALCISDKVLQFGALGFDLSIEEIFPTLLTGASLVLLPDGMTDDYRRFMEFIQLERITVLDMPTAYWHKMANLLEKYPLPKSVRLTVIGGEKAALESFALWQRFASQIRLINTYGPTETTVIATASENPETIGKPVANTCVYILDKYLKPLPIGVPGELFIGGAGVGKGYLNAPWKTANAFINNPFVPGEKMYRSGDLAEFSAAGEIIFRGRRDNQYKFRGFRIELGDIESAIKSYPFVLEVLVCLRKTGKNQSLAAYLRVADNDFDKNGLLKYLQGALPVYMIPTSITLIEQIPLNLSGKIDFAKLPNPDDENAIKSVTELFSALEMQVSLILERLLGCKGIDLNKTFIELGVDSLMVTEVILELEKFTGSKFTLEGFWHLPVRKYLQKIESGKNQISHDALIMLANNGTKAPLYLLHTLPGDILGYIDLVRNLKDRPIFGIQSPYLKTSVPESITLEELTEFYVDLVIKNHGNEKIYLCGWCFGGILAVELSRQLKKRGYEVAFLGLIETWMHSKKISDKFKRIYDLFQYGSKMSLTALRKHWFNSNFMMKNLEQDDFLEKRFYSSAPEKVSHLKKLYALNLRAGRNYEMKYYPGHLELFRSSITPEGMIPSKSLRWHGSCDTYHVEECCGEHQEILKYPNVKTLANKINEKLAELDAK